MVDGNGYNLRGIQFQCGFEVALDVTRFESSTQFDDGDALAGAIRTGRKVIELRNLQGRERPGGLCRQGMGGDARAMRAKMRPCLRTVVEAQNSSDYAIQFPGDMNGASAAAIQSPWRFVIQQLDVA